MYSVLNLPPAPLARAARLLSLFALLASASAWGQGLQENAAACPSPPEKIPSLTYDEDARYLANPSCGTNPLHQINDPKVADQTAAAQNAVGDNHDIRWFPVEEMNERLPRWIQFGGEYRAQVEGQDNIKWGTNKDLYFLNRFRLSTTIKPVKWFSMVAELQDARVLLNNRFIPNAPNYQDTWDLWQGYVQFGGPDSGWANLKVGRQVLEFGDGRVIGPSNWTNTARTFDAVLLDLQHAQSKVSLFASSVVVQQDGGFDRHVQGNNLYGIYGSSRDLIPQATLEPYVLWRVAPNNKKLTASSFPGKLSEVTVGVRLAGKLPNAFDYNMEMQRQTGSIGARSISAWAGYWSLGKTLHSVATTPRLFIESNYASGTKNPKGDWSTYDMIYPSEHDKLGFADQIGKRNIQQIRVGIEETIGKRRKLSLRQAYMNFWLATVHDGLYTNGGAPSLPAAPSVGARHVGQELDLIATYHLHKKCEIGFGYSRIFAGAYLKAVTDGRDFGYPFLYLRYSF
jgi:alginate export protein